MLESLWMNAIPLFPLNTVLFPGTPVHLHIFEPRYIQMVNDCVEQKQSFGVVLIRAGVEALGPLAEPHHIGCSAQIAQIQRLEDGRMNLVAIGQERFRLLTLDRDTKPYLLGHVQSYPLDNPDPVGASLRLTGLRRKFQRFVQLLLESGNNSQLDLKQLPEDGVSFAYLAAAVLQITPIQKQELLAAERLDRLIDRLSRHYSRELALLSVVLSQGDHLQAGGFSLN